MVIWQSFSNCVGISQVEDCPSARPVQISRDFAVYFIVCDSVGWLQRTICARNYTQRSSTLKKETYPSAIAEGARRATNVAHIRDGVENPVSYLGPFKRDRCADLLRHETALPRALPLIIAPAWPLCAPLHEYTPPNDAHTTQYSGRLFFAGENETSRSFCSPLKRPDWIGSSGMCRPSFYGGSKSGELRAVVSNAFERG